jgi:hypothetical protein
VSAIKVALAALVLTLVSAAPAQAGTIVVKQNTEPDSAQVFDYTAGGGLSPASFQLDDDDGMANNGISNNPRTASRAAAIAASTCSREGSATPVSVSSV